MQPITKTSHPTTIKCKIHPDDYREMRYYLDSGMFDGTRKNVAAIALAKAIRQGHQVEVKKDGRNGPYRCFIDGRKFVPSSNLEELIESAIRGIEMEGFEFEVTIPNHYVINPASPDPESGNPFELVLKRR